MGHTSLNDKIFIYYNMPPVCDYDIRIPVWNWILSGAKVKGNKAKVMRCPNFKLDVASIKKKEYFNGFFGHNQRRRRLKRVRDEKTLEEQKI